MTLLNAEVLAVSRTFEKHAQSVVRAAAAKRKPYKKWFLFGRRNHGFSDSKAEKLAAEALWCRRYAAVNATGLRKIAKKHDKYAHNSLGQKFLQGCWDVRNKAQGSFLHSPLIDELRAVVALSVACPGDAATNLHSDAPAAVFRAAAAAEERRSSIDYATSRRSFQHSALVPDGVNTEASCAAAGGEAAPAAVSPAAGFSDPVTVSQLKARAASVTNGGREGRHVRRSLRDSADAAAPDLQAMSIGSAGGSSGCGTPRTGDSTASQTFLCGICLAPMWIPVGLSCGHTFCKQCVLHSVGITDRSWMQPLSQVLLQVSSHAPCPQCRQHRVFDDVIELPELGAVICSKYGEEIEERAAEAAALAAQERKSARRLQAQERRNKFSQLMDQSFSYGL